MKISIHHWLRKIMQILEEEGAEGFVRRSARFAQHLMIKRVRGSFPYIYHRDLKNRVKYGIDAPIYGERIWINPSDVDMVICLDLRRFFGRVVDTWPPNDKQPIPIANNMKFKCCINHFMRGMTWEDTGIYDYMARLVAEAGGRAVDGCTNRDDIINRYKRMDSMFDQVKMERKLQTRKEINPKNFREDGGICIHVGPNGELFFGCEGIHRLCIARILKLSTVPAQIGCVHVSVIPLLPALRQNPDNREYEHE